MKSLLVASLALIIFTGCGKLTKKTAEQEILKNNPYPIVKYQDLTIQATFNGMGSIYDDLVNAGYAKRSTVWNKYTGNTSTVEPTDATKPFLKDSTNPNGGVLLYRVDFLGVSGISEEGNEANVRFKVNVTISPFIDVLHLVRFRNLPQGEVEYEVHFKKFDDGWKIDMPQLNQELIR